MATKKAHPDQAGLVDEDIRDFEIGLLQLRLSRWESGNFLRTSC